jgi:integrase
MAGDSVMLMRAVDSYLQVRHALGFRLRTDECLLRSFARFAAGRGETHVRVPVAIDWATLGSSPEQRARRLQVVATFARHLRAEDAGHEQPADGVFGRSRPPRRPPSLFSAAELRHLLDAASRLGPCGSLRPHTYRTLFGLLASTGLRISEALALHLDDVTPDGLVIRETKFRKQRLVPLHDTAFAALQIYLDRRRRARSFDDHVFVSMRGGPIAYPTAYKTFRTLVRAIQLPAVPRERRIHDLRHTFAVRALEACPHARHRVARHLLALSTYLGHSHVANTYWYLQATPELMLDIAEACEARVPTGAT